MSHAIRSISIIQKKSKSFQGSLEIKDKHFLSYFKKISWLIHFAICIPQKDNIHGGLFSVKLDRKIMDGDLIIY